MRTIGLLSLILVFAVSWAHAQSNNTTAGLAGVGAGAALGAGAGQGGTSPSTAGGSGAGNAPIEIQIMAFKGLQRIAKEIAGITANDLTECKDTGKTCAVLIEDTTSANQIALYRAVQGYADNLKAIHDNLQKKFPWQITAPTLTFSITKGDDQSTLKLTLKNTSGAIGTPLPKWEIYGTDKSQFVVDTSACSGFISVGGSCDVSIKFPTDPINTKVGKYSAELDIDSGEGEPPFKLPLSGTIAEKVITPKSAQVTQLATVTSGTTTATSPSSSGTPLDLQYLSGVTAAFSAAKSNITYTPSSFQPTTQAFEVLIERELKTNEKHIQSYTSTSALNLDAARDEWVKLFGEFLLDGSHITDWTNLCKPPAQSSTAPGSTGGKPADPKTALAFPACSDSAVLANLTVAQQMITGYTALLSSSNSGSGSPGIVDILRGKFLSERMDNGIPSLQVAVAAGRREYAGQQLLPAESDLYT
jgi:hypothetical protein